MIYHFEKHFTRDEANALVPWVRTVFAELHRILWPEEQQETAGNLKVSHSNGNGRSLANGNGNGNGHGHGHAEGIPLDYGSVPKEARRDASEKLLAALRDKGIVIQDVARGLIDFPSVVKGKEVFLCYQLSDGDKIRFYHDLDAGFKGRLPLEDEE